MLKIAYNMIALVYSFLSVIKSNTVFDKYLQRGSPQRALKPDSSGSPISDPDSTWSCVEATRHATTRISLLDW